MEMILVERTEKEIKEKIKERIEVLINEETRVCVHGYLNGAVIKNAVVIDEFELDENGLSLIGGWFEFYVNTVITKFSYDEETDSIYMKFENGEIYLDVNI